MSCEECYYFFIDFFKQFFKDFDEYTYYYSSSHQGRKSPIQEWFQMENLIDKQPSRPASTISESSCDEWVSVLDSNKIK